VTEPVHVFGSFGWLELKITVGELALAISTLAAAYWITRFIQKRQANDEATRDLMIKLCEDALQELSALSGAMEDCSSDCKIEDAGRQRIRRHMQRFSNSVHTIEVAAAKATLNKLTHRITEVKDLRQTLHTQITDPLVTDPGLNPDQLRQIEGTVRQTREALITLQLAIIQQ
jgi:hypothetical protein